MVPAGQETDARQPSTGPWSNQLPYFSPNPSCLVAAPTDARLSRLQAVQQQLADFVKYLNGFALVDTKCLSIFRVPAT